MHRASRSVCARRVRTPCPCRTQRGRARCRRRLEGGFTLVELMLVVAIIGILASIAAPPLKHARAAAVEVSIIGLLRTMNSAQTSFAGSCGGGSYALSVAWLSTPPTGTKSAFLGPEMTANTFTRQGYTIRFTAGTKVPTAAKTCNGFAAGQAVESYFIAADPLQVVSGRPLRYFGTSSSATIYQSTARVKAYYTGSPVAPAKPLK